MVHVHCLGGVNVDAVTDDDARPKSLECGLMTGLTRLESSVFFRLEVKTVGKMRILTVTRERRGDGGQFQLPCFIAQKRIILRLKA